MVAQRAAEPFPVGRVGTTHYRAVHRHLFQDVYRWADRFRTVRMAKGDGPFCYPENIDAQMRRLFDWLHRRDTLRNLTQGAFVAGSSHFLTDLNAIHPLRDGNGRTQLAFMRLIAARAGHPLDMTRLNRTRFLAAMIESFRGNEAPLRMQIRALLD